MTFTKAAVLVAFVALLGVPFLFRPAAPPTPAEALRLIIITPHNEQIRYEFARAFDRWHEEHYGRRVNVIYSVPGGTSEIRRMIFAQFAAAVEAGRSPGGDADLVFGGGTYEHEVLKQGVTVSVDGQRRRQPITTAVDFPDEWLEATYGPNVIGDGLLYDPEKHWFGTALSGFGIVYNRDALAQLGLPEPLMWEALCAPRLRGWVALVNPAQSGSITTAFDTILQRRGWERGWGILRRAGANARYFSASALKPPIDVSQGEAAMGVCIDFYGRYQAQAIAARGGGERVGYIDPPGATTIDADPISKLRGAPHPELARRFIEFCLTEEAQALWQFPARGPRPFSFEGGSAGTQNSRRPLGPERFELRRLPVLRSMYEQHLDRMIDGVDAFAIAAPVDDPNPHYRSFIAVLFGAMAMDAHGHLIRAWEAIVNHPAYPRDPDPDAIVTAEDVTDPTLRRMLELFDAMPEIDAPEGERWSLADADHLSEIRQGWLEEQWAGHGLWHREGGPVDEMRRRAVRFFRENYREIVRLGAEGERSDAAPGGAAPGGSPGRSRPVHHLSQYPVTSASIRGDSSAPLAHDPPARHGALCHPTLFRQTCSVQPCSVAPRCEPGVKCRKRTGRR